LSAIEVFKRCQMNSRGLLSLADRYVGLLENNGAILRRADLHQHFALPADRSVLLNHARWQVEIARRVLHRLGGETTAIRMIGAAQGVLISTGLLTIAETLHDNEEWLSGSSVRALESTILELDESAQNQV
jgi:hypothetical protein